MPKGQRLEHLKDGEILYWYAHGETVSRMGRRFGTNPQNVTNRLSRMRKVCGAKTNAEMMYRLGVLHGRQGRYETMDREKVEDDQTDIVGS